MRCAPPAGGAQTGPFSEAKKTAPLPPVPGAQPIYGAAEKRLVLAALALGAACRAIPLAEALWSYSAFWAAFTLVFLVWQWPRARRNATAWLVLGAAAALLVLLPYQAELDYMGWMMFPGLLAIPCTLMLYAVFVLYDVPAGREGMAVLGLIYGFLCCRFHRSGAFSARCRRRCGAGTGGLAARSGRC